MSPRIINLGLPKTGTTTLARALRRAGLRVADHRIRAQQTEDPELQGAYVGDLVYKGYFLTGDPLHYFDGFDALSEMSLIREGRSLWPQTDFALIRAIRRHHPETRFLASRRDSFEVSQSMLAWSDLGTSRLPQGTVPGLPPGYGETSKERELWIEGHYANLREIFGDAPEFMEYQTARPGTKARLSTFLGVNLPWWGRANSNPISLVS